MDRSTPTVEELAADTTAPMDVDARPRRLHRPRTAVVVDADVDPVGDRARGVRAADWPKLDWLLVPLALPLTS